MTGLKISYLITCHDEERTLKNLFNALAQDLFFNREIVILHDDFHNPKTKDIVDQFSTDPKVKVKYHKLGGDYSEHKNAGVHMCSGNWIFQCDGDECLPPSGFLCGENLETIIKTAEKSGVELIYVPRINDYRGVTKIHAEQWGWRLTPSVFCGGRDIVQWPDFQGRIFKKDFPRIHWERKLHEKIEGHTQYSLLPAEEDYALYHDKTIGKQIETNLRYNKIFTLEENMGHKVL